METDARCERITRRPRLEKGFGIFLLFLLGVSGRSGVAAQAAIPPSTEALTAQAPAAQVLAVERVTPRGAFIRSLVVPGWGHVAVESFTRGGVYLAGQSGSLWMLWTSLRRKSEAAAFGRVERMAVEARLSAWGITDPDSLRVAVEEDPAVREWGDLVRARGQQVEDWIAVSIFATLLGAADAYVAAHLADYPTPLAIRAFPAGLDGGIELAVSLPVGGVRGRRGSAP